MLPNPTETLGSIRPFRASFEELREQARDAIDAGSLDHALGLLDGALTEARDSGDQNLIDLAICNRAAVAVTLGRFEGEIPQLRFILLRNALEATCFTAAYTLSHAYELKKDFKKALFYAQIARDKALAENDGELIAKSHNQIGNCLLAESYLEQAVDEYHRALELLPETWSVERAMILANLAYTKVLLGEHREGFRLLFACLRWYRRTGKRVYTAWQHLFLCYAYLDIDRLHRAWTHGHRALSAAESTGDYDAIKNALFLLGEVEKSAGDYTAAAEYYKRLQHEFYPDNPSIPEMMMVVESKQIVNLRA